MRDSIIWDPGRVHLLIDPDKWNPTDLTALFSSIPRVVGSIIVAGTFVHTNHFEEVMRCCLKTALPVGNMVTAGPPANSISPHANFLLIPLVFGTGSTRFVFDHVIQAVPMIEQYNLSVVSYAYVMLAGGSVTSAEYFTQTIALPRNKFEILKTLTLTARYLGLEGIYLEAGSGALNPVTPEEVKTVVDAGGLPVIVGGGLKTRKGCQELFGAGATGLIVGTAIEEGNSLSWLEGI